MNYDEITLEECFIIYNKGKTACECDGDKREVKFVEE